MNIRKSAILRSYRLTKRTLRAIIRTANGGSCRERAVVPHSIYCREKAASLSTGSGYFFMYPRIPKMIVAIKSRSAMTSKAVMAITSLLPREEQPRRLLYSLYHVIPCHSTAIWAVFCLFRQGTNEKAENALRLRFIPHFPFSILHYCAFALVILSVARRMPSLPDSYVRPPCI